MYQQLLHKVVTSLLGRNTTFFTSILAIAIFGMACTPTRESSSATQPNTAQSPASTTSQAGEEQATITMAVIPWQVSAEQEKKLEPLANYLSKALKRPFKFEITKDYETAIDLLVKKKVDIAYLAPTSYIEAHRRDPKVEPLVAQINKETKRPWYTAVIIANKTSGIKTLKDLKGKRFAFVTKLSTSGYVVPTVHFQEININPERDFSSVIFAGSHDKAKQALVNGEVDAIADDRRSYTDQVNEGKIDPKKYTIIWESVPLPSVPLVASSKVSVELKDNLKKALIDAPTGLVDPTGGIGVGYTLVQDGDYDIVRELQKRVSSK